LYSDFSSQFGITLQNNLVRTWIYVHDIDNNYNAMVEARKEFFDRHGLTAATRYVASTGIQGKAAEDGALVALDSLSFGDIREEQIETMNALDRLSPTILYGVTFERGLRVKFGDRSHLYISGTASIDKEGNILHGDDVGKQAGRTLENVEALLKNQGATFEDLAYALVYIRNPEHGRCVRDILEARLPKHVPLLLVEAAVCRPGWLFEMEGVGIIPDNNPYPPFL
jgi:enamine deaminase RidA (YjgF/YER057c/UK114 family)